MLFDIAGGLGLVRFWSTLAWQDWRQRYHRSILGVAWILISFAAFVGAKVLIFGTISTAESAYFAVFVVLGFLAWQFISAIIVEGCYVFIGSELWIKGIDIPLFTFVYQSVMRNVISFAVSAICAFAVMFYFQVEFNETSLYALAALGAYLVNAIWVQALFGLISARFRDFAHLVQTVMRLMFFLTPIIWIPAQMGGLQKYLYYNPFTHFLEIFRAPIMDGDPALDSWRIVLWITGIGWLTAIMAFSRFRNRIVFWI